MIMSNITLTWRGHSCFRIESDGYSVVTDPFTDDTVPGYGHVRETADEVICSHEHGDHNFRDGVTVREEHPANPFRVTVVECPHDDAGGSKRGMNKIHVFDNGTLRVAHFGDIGCPLDEAQREAIGKLDAVMVPVGGFYTMEPDGIAELMEQLAPRVIIPMHYRSDMFGYPVIGTLDAYLKLVKGDVIRYDTNQITITPETPAQTAVLAYQG